MPKIELKLRDLESGETLVAEIGSVEEACAWLRDRPRMTEVLGVPTPHLSKEDHATLRAAARPLEPDELARRKVLEDAEAEAERAREQEERRAEEAEIEAYKESLQQADPDRPMEIVWTRGGGMRLQDPYDPREITAAARDAVLAWVEERESWVRDREQVVAEALVTVWPGPIPGGGERVQRGGTFIPAAAPKP